MATKEEIQNTNSELRSKIGYDPYLPVAISDDSDEFSVRCSVCGGEVELKSTVKTTRFQGITKQIHDCTGHCKYVRGVNIGLVDHVTKMIKDLGFLERDIVDKNTYNDPKDILKLRTVEEGNFQDFEMSLEDLNDIYYNKFLGPDPIVPLDKKDVDEGLKEDETIVEEIVEEIKSEEEPLPPVEAAPVEPVAPIVEEVVQEKKEEIVENVDFFGDDILNDGGVIDTNVDGIADIIDSEMDDYFKDICGESNEMDEISKEAEDFFRDTDLPESTIKDITDFFDDIKENEVINLKTVPYTEKPDINSTGVKSIHSFEDNGYRAEMGSTTGASTQQDKIVTDREEELRKLSSAEYDVFNIEKREIPIGQSITSNRLSDLINDFNDSNMKIVVDRITKLIKSKTKHTLHTNVIINEYTKECPVVDFSCGIRIIYIDTDINGSSRDITGYINSHIRHSFYKTVKEEDVICYPVFTDQIQTTFINRVVSAICKVICYKLNVKDIYVPVSLTRDTVKGNITRYFYTTKDRDVTAFEEFNYSNNAGGIRKGANRELGIIAEFKNDDQQAQYRKYVQNMNSIARGENIKYRDLSMAIMCSMKYILIDNKDGNINVTVTDYTENLGLFVADGFGVCIAALVQETKSQFPNSKLHVYFEMDNSMILSPTLARYFKMGSFTDIDDNTTIKNINKIMQIVGRDHDYTAPKLYVNGEPFDTKEYREDAQVNYIFKGDSRGFNPQDQCRRDWREFNAKSFAKVMGDKYPEVRKMDVSDPKVRATIMERVNLVAVAQPKVNKFRVVDDFCRTAWNEVSKTCSGIFSIAKYNQENSSHVKDNLYMVNGSVDMNYMNQRYTGNILSQQMPLPGMDSVLQAASAMRSVMGDGFFR